MGQGSSSRPAAPPPPPPPQQEGPVEWARERLTRANRKASSYAASARAVWAGTDFVAAKDQQGRRLRKQYNALAAAPETAAIAIGVGSVSGGAAFVTSRFGVTFLLQSLRVSSHNRAAAAVGGALGMLVASNVAAHSFLVTSTLVAERRGHKEWPFLPVSPSSPSFALLTGSVAVLSLLQFRVLRGRLRYWSPSDIIRPGTFAGRTSLPAPGNDYADHAMKKALWQQGRVQGCHSCGRRRKWAGVGSTLAFIGDHIPPNKYAKIADALSGATDTGPKPWWQLLMPFLRPRKTPQVFLPQCERCSLIQSAAVRNDRRTLIFPRSFRSYDLWTPLPLLIAMMIIPILQEMQQRWRDERAREDFKDKVRRVWG